MAKTPAKKAAKKLPPKKTIRQSMLKLEIKMQEAYKKDRKQLPKLFKKHDALRAKSIAAIAKRKPTAVKPKIIKTPKPPRPPSGRMAKAKTPR